MTDQNATTMPVPPPLDEQCECEKRNASRTNSPKAYHLASLEAERDCRERQLSAAIRRAEDAERERDIVESLARAAESSTSPCGHLARYAHTEDGGKTIECYACLAAERLSKIAGLEEENRRMQKELTAAVVRLDTRVAQHLRAAERAHSERKPDTRIQAEAYAFAYDYSASCIRAALAPAESEAAGA